MNAIEQLEYDHQTLRRLFSKYVATDNDDLDTRENLFQVIERELLAHAEAEEGIFYPSIRDQAPDIIQEPFSEHQEIKQLLSEMLEYEVDDEEFEQRMITLIKKVESHVRRDESANGALEIARQRFSKEELDHIGRRIQQRKRATAEELAA